MNRRIAVFTSSRADLGPLGPVIGELDRRADVDLVVIATGTHLTAEFGGRLDDIVLQGDSVLEAIDVSIDGTETAELGEVYGRVAAGTSRVLARREVDFIVLLGDRWELLAAAGAALIHGVPIAHLHGGETTEGAIDERIRHGITKLSDLHLCANQDSAGRIRQLGEEAWRIIVTGAPGLDRIAATVPFTDEEIVALLGRPIERPVGVVVYHPPTVDRSQVAQEARAVLEASAAALGTGIVLFPGADPGSQVVIDEILSAERKHSNLVSVKNLGPAYLRLLSAADVMIGNSSSGIIEAASFDLPVIDVGDRQRGRLRPENVRHVQVPSDLADALHESLRSERRAELTGMVNPYGDGKAAPRIVDALLEVDLSRLARKPLVEVVSPQERLDHLTVPLNATIRQAMEAIDRGGYQIAMVVDADRRLLGTISDGDLRRAILGGAILADPVSEHLTRAPITVRPDADPLSVLDAMRREGVTQVPVLAPDGRLVGVHLMRAMVGELFEAPAGTGS